MKVLEVDSIQKFIKMAYDGWLKGWNECHGGNISFRLSPRNIMNCEDIDKTTDEWFALEKGLPEIAGEIFAITGSGKFMSNIRILPEDTFGIIEISSNGEKYRKIWGFQGGGKPTSELMVHLMNQSVKKITTNGTHKVIYHAHPSNIIALSFLLEAKDEIFTRELWEIMPECAMTFPGGMGALPWMIPGTVEIAELTCKKMQLYDAVLWAQHGLFVSGDTFDNAFGLMDTLDKSSEIYLKTLNTGMKRHVPDENDLRAMAKVFHLDLPERFLFSKSLKRT